MKHYKTKTGTYIHCLQGEGLGDGIPRAKLQLVNDSYRPEIPKRRWIEFVMNEKITVIKIGSFEYKKEKVS